MEFIIIGIVSAINLIVIVHKFKKGRVEDGIFDSLLFALMAFLFQGSYGGMVVAMISSLIISIYLLASPPTFFRRIMGRPDVKKAVDELKSCAEYRPKTKSRKKTLEQELEDLDFD